MAVNPLFNLGPLFELAAYPKKRGAAPRGWQTIRMFEEDSFIEARDFVMKLPRPETATKFRCLFLVSKDEGSVLFFSEKKKKVEE